MLLQILRGRGKQPWRWRIRFPGNNEMGARSEEPFPDERAVTDAAGRFLAELGVSDIEFMGHEVHGMTAQFYAKRFRELMKSEKGMATTNYKKLIRVRRTR